MRKYLKKNCVFCNKEFKAREDEDKRGYAKYCSKICLIEMMKINRKGEKHPNWKGGRIITQKGYVKCWSPGHPNADRNGRVFEHRLIMEQNLGRYLLPHEVVHHIDGNITNNSIENLSLFESNAKHKQCHNFERLNKKQSV